MTDRLNQVYAAIVAHKQAHNGNPPTIRQLCAATGITSTSMIEIYLAKLVDQGRITRNGGIEVVGGEWRLNA